MRNGNWSHEENPKNRKGWVMFKKIGSFLQKVAKSTVAKCAAVVVGVSMATMSAMATDPVTLRPWAVDVGSYITAGITVIGATVAVALGGFAAFWVIRKSLRWFNKVGYPGLGARWGFSWLSVPFCVDWGRYGNGDG